MSGAATALADPTMRLFEELENPALYERHDNVPVFCIHRRKMIDGQLEDVGPTQLQQVIDQQHEDEHASGVIPRITLGHTFPDKTTRENAQPRPVGYSRNWRLGRFGPGKKLAILGTMYYRLADADECHTYPYRSVEFYPERREITGVALLRRDPQLDLGIMTYARTGDCYHYALETDRMPEPTVIPPAGDQAGPTGTPDAGAPTPEESDRYMRCCRANTPSLYGLHEHMAKGGSPAQYAFGSGSNGAVPAPAPAAPPVPPPANAGAEAERMYRDQLAIHYARNDQRLAALERDNQQLRYQRDEAVCERSVTQLEAEGYLIRDRAKLTRDLSRLTEAERTERLTDIRTNYQRDPEAASRIPVPVLVGDAPRPGETGTFTERHLDEATQYMREHIGCTWEAAKDYALKTVK